MSNLKAQREALRRKVNELHQETTRLGRLLARERVARVALEEQLDAQDDVIRTAKALIARSKRQ